MSRISFFCTTMRRFFHRKTQTRPGQSTSTASQPGHRPRGTSSSSSAPVHPQGPPPTAPGRTRAPNLRSRSMSVLSGPSVSGTTRKFTRSLSFCAEQSPSSAERSSGLVRQLTTTEEDEVFRSYTNRVYVLFGAMCAVITGLAVYAYLYNYGNI